MGRMAPRCVAFRLGQSIAAPRDLVTRSSICSSGLKTEGEILGPLGPWLNMALIGKTIGSTIDQDRDSVG